MKRIVFCLANVFVALVSFGMSCTTYIHDDVIISRVDSVQFCETMFCNGFTYTSVDNNCIEWVTTQGNNITTLFNENGEMCVLCINIDLPMDDFWNEETINRNYSNFDNECFNEINGVISSYNEQCKFMVSAIEIGEDNNANLYNVCVKLSPIEY